MLLDVSFEVGVDQDTANVLTQNRVTSAQARLPQEVIAAGRHRQEAEPEHPDAHLGLLARGELRRELPDQLLRHQPAGPDPAHPRHRPGRSLRRHRLRHAHLAPARQAGQARADAGRRDLGDQGAEPPGPGRAGRRSALAQGPGVHLHRRRAGPARSRRRSSRTSSSAGTATAAQVRIRDVGRAELGSQDYNSFGRLDGKPAGAMAVYLLPGANQLEAAKQIYETMARAKDALPARHGLQDRLRHDAGRRGLDRRRSSRPSSRR